MNCQIMVPKQISSEEGGVSAAGSGFTLSAGLNLTLLAACLSI